jgi:hypothetical protein
LKTPCIFSKEIDKHALPITATKSREVRLSIRFLLILRRRLANCNISFVYYINLISRSWTTCKKTPRLPYTPNLHCTSTRTFENTNLGLTILSHWRFNLHNTTMSSVAQILMIVRVNVSHNNFGRITEKLDKRERERANYTESLVIPSRALFLFLVTQCYQLH